MLEETGLTVEPGRLIGQVQRPGLAGDVIDIKDYAATVIGGTLRPGMTPPMRAGSIPGIWAFSRSQKGW